MLYQPRPSFSIYGIIGLPTSEACYADAVELLKERFGDRKRIVQLHLTALRHLPHVKSGSDVRGLRNRTGLGRKGGGWASCDDS